MEAIALDIAVTASALFLALLFVGHSSVVPPKRKKGIEENETAQRAVSKLLEDLVNDASDTLDEICQRLDTRTPGLGNYENIAKHYGYKVSTVRSRFETSPDGASKALILAIIAEHPGVTVASLAKVVVKQTRREDVARLLREFDRK
ncbi:uncharacterized protein LOC122953267 [Acropora millepora]|uniref:uncharacterized protein LOC122953267 n=1 Tax=Acropora millepora TaxID=45264 RepID=UPI001CF30866|nr:uncharacterized protein LOC122953267 [Acropora millepora]